MYRKEKFNACLFRLTANLACNGGFSDAWKELSRLEELTETEREQKIHDNMCEQVEDAYKEEFPEYVIVL